MVDADHVPVVNVPTEVRLDAVTPDPRVLPLKTLVALILNSLPETRSICSLLVQLSLAFNQRNSLFVAPSKLIPPPSAVESVGVLTLPSVIFLSVTSSC